MPPLRSHKAAWLLILSLALAVRLAMAVWWQKNMPPGETFRLGDSVGYWALARTIAHGDPFAYPQPEFLIHRTPGYPLVLSPLFLLYGDDPPVLAGRALSAVLGTLAVGIVGWWTTRLFNPRAGVWAGWIAAFYPGAILMSVLVLSEAPFCPLMLLQLASWGLASRAATNSRAALWGAVSGGLGGMASLVRPSWLLFLPFALVIALAFDRHRRRQALIGLCMGASLALVMLPWWVRSARITGHFVLTCLHVGAGLYDGLNPQADGSSNFYFYPRFVEEQLAEDAAMAGESTFEYRLDRRMSRAAFEWAKANPARVAQLVWIKFLRMWNVWPNEPSFRSWPVRLAVAGSYVPLLALILLGAWRFSRGGWAYVLLWLPAVYLTVLHVICVGSLRYREPAMLAAVPLAAAVLARVRIEAPADN